MRRRAGFIGILKYSEFVLANAPTANVPIATAARFL